MPWCIGYLEWSEFSVGFVSRGLAFLAEIVVADHLLDLRPSSFELVMLSETLVGFPHSLVAVCLGFVDFLNQSGLISGDDRHLMSCRQIPFRVLSQ